jgi:hypothetical protein
MVLRARCQKILIYLNLVLEVFDNQIPQRGQQNSGSVTFASASVAQVTMGNQNGVRATV